MQLHHGAQGIRQVGLQDDTGREIRELGLIQNSSEDRDGEVEIFVLFHVEVDEFRWSGRSGELEERGELVDHMIDISIERPRGVWCNGGRNFDRDVVHVWAREQIACAGEASRGFSVTENRFAEKVDVQLGAAGPQCGD